MTPTQNSKTFVHNYIEHGEWDITYNDHKSVHFQREQKHIIFAASQSRHIHLLRSLGTGKIEFYANEPQALTSPPIRTDV